MPFPADIDLVDLDGTNGFRLNGVASFDSSGKSLASAGDVNGDGYDDIIIGARLADPNGDSSGASYVVFGKAEGFSAELELSSLDGTNGFKLSGEAAIDYSGGSVASAGDVNADGYDDLLIGAEGADPNGQSSGASYVVFGKTGGFAANVDLVDLDGTNGFKLIGVAPYDFTGASVASAGDVNGDGFDDVIISAEGADPNGTTSGASYVVFGKAGGFTAELQLSSLDGTNGFKLSGVSAYSQIGYDVASAGDVNGDGTDDLLVSSPYAGPSFSGTSYIVFGKVGGFAAELDLSSLDGTNGFKATGASDFSGRSVASAGDVNGDGFADLLIGAPYASPNSDKSGASYVVFGKAGGFAANLDLATLDGTNGFKLNGASYYDLSGASVAAAGDVNGDGFDDFIVGSGFSSHDPSYVVYGKAGGFAAELELSSLDGTNGFKVSNSHPFEDIFSVASAGDVNGDGFDDLLFGDFDGDPTEYKSSGDYVLFDRNARPEGYNSGESYVLFGVKPDTAVTRDGTGASQTLAGGDFDDALRGMGGDDALWGHGGADVLDGGTGDDVMRGGGGDDTYVVDRGGDRVIEVAESGVDSVATSVSLTLDAGVENGFLLPGASSLVGNDLDNGLIGNAAANDLAGGAGDDTLTGDDGADRLDGGGGDDRLSGGNGADKLAGGLDRDVLIGGADPDIFDFDAIAESAVGADRDAIFDFMSGADIIDLSDIDAATGSDGDQAFAFIGAQGFSGAAGELRFSDLGPACLVQGDVDGDTVADLEIFVVAATLAEGDFLL
jgi:Ca2+-binding RTX toxin-like protein